MLETIVWVMLIKDNQIYLLERLYQDKIEHSLVGGHVEVGESIKEALIREVYEEIGIIIEESSIKFESVIDRKTEIGIHKVHFFFSSGKYNGEPYNKEENKHISAGWFDLDRLPEDIGPLAKIAIESINKDNKFFEYGPLKL